MNNEYTMPEFFISLVITLLLLVLNADAKTLAGMGFNDYLQKYAEVQKNKMDRYDKYKTNRSDMSAVFGISKLSDNFVEFLKYSKIYDKVEPGKKMVLYINFYDNPNDMEQAENLKNLNGYKNSSDWTKKFTFVEYRISSNGEFRASKEIQEGFREFFNSCQTFCVIDFDKGTVFKGKKKSDSQYLYSVLAAYYK